VRGGDVATYLADNVPAADRPGPIVDSGGRTVGEHAGFGRYTIGQRKGLGVSLGVPVFVTQIDPATNSIRVGGREDLRVGGFTLEEVSAVGSPPAPGDRVLVQHRAHGEVTRAAIVTTDAGAAEVHFEEPAEALAAGQSAAFYSSDEPDVLLGGGVIKATIPATALV
jgi:tRNA-specific 2-thiouridylase